MTFKINTYFAILIVTIAGAAATLLIVHFAFASTFNVVLINGATGYTYFLQ